jgi:hypothetical protein
MTEHEASRTLVKSPPELWAECSNAGSLARHLGEFGEIRITKLEPETVIAWEGDVARGTVRLEPSGWGTRVILTAAVESVAETESVAKPEPAAESETVAEPDPALEAEAELEPAEPETAEIPGLAEILYAPEPLGPMVLELEPRRNFLARVMSRFRRPRDLPAPGEPVAAVDVAVESVESVGVGGSEPGDPAPVDPGPVDPEPSPIEPQPPPGPEPPSPETVLASALDSLGSAHHRPFSRA